jgi:DNA polymerase-3 subunit alpha
VFFINDCRENFNLTVENPSVNYSNWAFVPKDKSTIVYGLGGIKGVGEGAVESIVSARQTGGNFTDLYDFCRRVDTKRVNKRTLEALVRAGCFDDFAASLRPDLPADRAFDIRGALMAELPKAVQAAEQERQNDNLGMIDMFAEIADVTAAPPLPTTPIWSDAERLKGEKDTLGLFLTGHPIDTYRDELKRYTKATLSKLSETKFRETTTFAGLIMDVANFGNRVVISLDDGTGRIEVSCYAERFARVKDKLKLETVVVIEGTVREREGQLYGALTDVMTLTDARKRWLKKISVKISGNDITLLQQLQSLLVKADNSTVHYLSHQLGNQVGNSMDYAMDSMDTDNATQRLGVPLNLSVYTQYASAELQMPAHWQIVPDDETFNQLKSWVAPEHLTLEF